MIWPWYPFLSRHMLCPTQLHRGYQADRKRLNSKLNDSGRCVSLPNILYCQVQPVTCCNWLVDLAHVNGFSLVVFRPGLA